MHARILAFLALLGNWANAEATYHGFLRAQGRFIGNDTGTVQLRGVGLGGWMLQEGYMIGTAGFAGTQHEVRARLESVVGTERTEAFYRKWRSRFVTSEEIDSLRAWGFNSVRLPMHWNLYMEPGLPIRWKSEGFELTDSLLAWCKARGMWLILDLHAAPGGQGNDNNISDRDPGGPSLWQSADHRTMSVELWRKLAQRYRDEPAIGAYDLLNEPNWPFDGTHPNGCEETSNAPLRGLLMDMTNAIREVDSRHLVVIEGNCWGGNYEGIMPPWDGNMAISFHKYWNSPDAGSVNPLFRLRDTHDRPIWCGESGENGNEWFRRTLGMFEKERIGWSWWPLKKIESVVGPVSVRTTAGWEAFLAWGNKTGPKPDSALLDRGMEELLDNLRLSRCRIQRDVLDAMFRQVRTDSIRPWREIRVPGTFGAEEYDLGREGSAYRDLGSMRVDGTGSVDWNSGWSFRNDGVDIQWSTEEGGWNIGWQEATEWRSYTLQADTTAEFVLVSRVAGPGGEFSIEVDGTVAGALSTPPTRGWTDWTQARSGPFRLSEGTHRLRLVTTRPGYNQGRISLVPSGSPCLEAGNCHLAHASAPSPRKTPRIVWTAEGLVSDSPQPLAVRVLEGRGRLLLEAVLEPGAAIPQSRLPRRGRLLVTVAGGETLHLARF